jgi:signal transduction protein with GAF and PtsI domain
MEKKEEIRIPWGTGIVGYVAESGEPVNIPDAYKVSVEVVTHSASRLCVS